MLNNDCLYYIAIYSPSILLNLQLVFKSFWKYYRNLSQEYRDKIRQSFQKKRETFKNGILKMWSELPNGKKDSSYYETFAYSKIIRIYAEYSNGKLHGVYKSWTYEGIVDELYYVNGNIKNI